MFFAESATTGSVLGVWDGTFLTPATTRAFSFGVSARATKATAVYGVYGPGTSLAARSET